ncbi:MAG: hypothetical protein ABSF44_14575 [Candidatus Bathyarchaeia archaeon]
MLVPSFNMASGHEASYGVSQDGNTAVAVHSIKPLNFRGIYIGAASLAFGWDSDGKSRYWRFTPTILDPTRAQYSEASADNGQTQIINVNLGDKMFPVSGLIDPSLNGEIIAPAIHFDLPHAYDLWVFLLRSPWFPLKIGIEKSSLNISHNLAQATAEIENISPDLGSEQSLRADVSVHGEGLNLVKLTMQRSMKRVSLDEELGELTSGMQTFNWKPTIRNFDVLLVTPSNMDFGEFVDFLKYLGAEIHQGKFMPASLINYFLLCDGLNVSYRLSLTGEKHFLGQEKDETAIMLKP